MDIRKLQRAIVDGLEDVKAQNIAVFNTEALSPLFERVIIASGTSNRQTKALASSVRDAVKSRGLQVLRTEGEENGEWIIVDCGAAVAHIMQPAIREYYHLEEIWGGKNVSMKMGAKGPVASAAPGDIADAPRTPRKTGGKTTGKSGSSTAASKAPPAGRGYDDALTRPTPAKKVSAKRGPVNRAAPSAPARGAAKGSAAKAPAKSTRSAAKPAAKTSSRSAPRAAVKTATRAPARKAGASAARKPRG